MVKLIENIISNTLVHKHKSKYLSLSKTKDCARNGRCFCYTDVLTSIKDKALILVRNTYRNSKSKVLNSISKFDIFGERLSKAWA